MYKEIQKQFNEVISYSQGIANPQTNDLFERWYNNKAWFREHFRNQLIVNCGEVSFALDKATKNEKVSNFLDYVDMEYHLYDLTSFIDCQRDSFFQNETCEDYEYKGTKIPAGAKLVKSFKHFITNPDLLNEIQNKASMIIQDDKVHGELCFSIHPLDFLSVSETTYKWRSCHALDGEYRAGNLSYMADGCTMVCYLKSKEDENLPNFPESIKWNSKKWRCLLFMSESKNEIFFGRQYPMFSEDALAQVIVTLQKRQILPGWWVPPYKDSIDRVAGLNYWSLYSRYYPVHNGLWAVDDMVQDKSALHFNDLLRSSCYIPYISYNMDVYYSKTDKPIFEVGAEVKCLACGNELICPGDNGGMLCSNCDPDDWDGDTYYCDYCDGSDREENMYFINGVSICQNCISEHTAPCKDCGGLHLKTKSRIDKDGNRFCTDWCMNRYTERDLEETIWTIEYKPFDREEE